jgi:hypothetical protein
VQKKRKTNPLPIHARQEGRKEKTTRLPDDTCTFFLLPLLSLSFLRKSNTSSQVNFPSHLSAYFPKKPEEHRRTTMKNKGVSSGPDRHLQCKRRNRTPDNQPPFNTETKTKLRSVVSRSFQERRRVANCAGIDHVTVESIPTPPIAIQIAEHLCSSIPELVDV